LDVSKNIELWELSLHGNQFSAASLDTVFETLHSSTLYNPNRTEIGKVIYIRNNPGALTCDRSIATSKGWLVDTTFQR